MGLGSQQSTTPPTVAAPVAEKLAGATKPADGGKPAAAAPGGGSGAEIVQLSPFAFRMVLLSLFLSMFLATLDMTVVVTALPTIVGEFQRLDLLSWIVSSYLLTSSAVIPIYGKLSDVYGRKSMMLAAITIFVVGSALCGAAQSMTWLIAARAVQGLGGGGLMQLVMTIMGDIVAPRERGKYQSLIAITFAISSILGPLVGGGLTDAVSWRWVFYINIPFALPAVIIDAVYLNIDRQRLARSIDVAGSLMIVGATTLCILGVTFGGNQFAWDSATVISLIVVGALCFPIFLLIEAYVKEPMMPLHLLKIRNIVVMVLLAIASGIGMFSMMSLLPLYFQVIENESATKSGLSVIPMTAAVVVASMVAGGYVSKTGRYRFIPSLGAAFLTLGVGLFGLINAHFSYGWVALFLVFCGFGVGLVMPNLVLIAQNSVELKDLAAVTALIAFIRSLGGATGTVIFQAVFIHFLGNNLPMCLKWLQNVPPDQVRDNQRLFTSCPVSDVPDPLGEYLDDYAAALASTFSYMAIPLAISCIVALAVKHVPLRVGRPAAQSQPNKAGAAGAQQPSAVPGQAVQIEVVPSQTQPPLISEPGAAANEPSAAESNNAAPAETWQEISTAPQVEGQQSSIAAGEVAVAVEVAQLATGAVAADIESPAPEQVYFHGSE